MSSGQDRDGCPHSDSNVLVDVSGPMPRADFGSIQLQSIESPSGVASQSSPESRQVAADDKTMAPSSDASALSSRSNAGNKAKQKRVKPRRVRTGCLTCRERRLKCDEALHRCQNCRKSGRVCRRGVRLNFIDTRTAAPHCISRPYGTPVTFQDDSRFIASQYVGGEERYPPPQSDPPLGQDEGSPFDFSNIFSGDILADADLMMDDPFISTFDNFQSDSADILFNLDPSSTYHPSWPEQTIPNSPFNSANQVTFNTCNRRVLHSDQKEALFLQTFVDEVGCWMDLLDPMKHEKFTEILLFHTLEEPMVKNAFIACGARHLCLTTQDFGKGIASCFYEEASRYIFESIQNPDRNSSMCASAALALNVYEAMCPTLMNDMYHTAGARALIKECGWDARTPGVGRACFWISIITELLHCLHFSWIMSWDPDTWGVDINIDDASSKIVGDEESWIHRIIYICAKISNFRSSARQLQMDNQDHNVHLSKRCKEWDELTDLCNRWYEAIPRSMAPLSYIPVSSSSALPQVWLVKRSAIIAQLFYHTARVLLTKIHPLESGSSPEMQRTQKLHAKDICGIVAHMKDRGTATFPIWFLIIGAECLVEKEAQEDVLKVIDDLLKDNSFRAEYIKNELRKAWGSTSSSSHQKAPGVNAVSDNNMFSALDSASIFSKQHQMKPGLVNPAMAAADFSVEGHPYKNYYVPPLGRTDDFQFGNY
ncbi:hypothetical protein PHISCL_09993 [Aspergillus sclerotialis]|uniref:Zn(2)-C6 fungal-type domain-containing protein n=1 Tax=Aspergillus sclerotialis TaxID=2070753 RepID=A0A3A2Z3L7_9EURO|nr:hypothetical protein PHISCL_09993 [Aspergillus sclerotialis]